MWPTGLTPPMVQPVTSVDPFVPVIVAASTGCSKLPFTNGPTGITVRIAG